MTLVMRFVPPTPRVVALGLRVTDMPRLGRIVGLAGKNGAGKSRLLGLLEEVITERADALSNLNEIRTQIRRDEDAASQWTSSNKEVPQHLSHRLEQGRARLSSITDLAHLEDAFGAANAFRFVPKRLDLADPRELTRNEVARRAYLATIARAGDPNSTSVPYIQQVQDQWWTANDQRFTGAPDEVRIATDAYESLDEVVTKLMGRPLGRDRENNVTLFGKPIGHASLSDGQKVLLQLAAALHAQRGRLDNTVFILDEPENHLHPSATVDFISMLYEAAPTSQIWLATHSVPLLAYVASVEPMGLWYVDDGAVSNAGRHPEKVLNTLLGDEARIAQLHSFIGLPAQLAAVNYALQSLLPPDVLRDGSGDAQVSQIARLLSTAHEGSPLRLLDFGAGKGRILDGLAAAYRQSNREVSAEVDYLAYDPSPENREICKQVITTHYGSAAGRYFGSADDFFAKRDDGSVDVVVLCNVLHEISPLKWPEAFGPDSLIWRCLSDKGYVLLVEDQRIPSGERAHEYGFLVLDTPQLRTLLSVTEEECQAGQFVWDDAREDGRLKAHIIAKTLLSRITGASRSEAIKQLRASSKEAINKVRDEIPSYSNGQIHAFWLQQFANASLFLDQAL